MKNKKVIQIYDQVAEEYARRYDPLESEEDLIFLNTFLAHLKPGSHVVDLGCGTGYSTRFFQKNRMVAEGVDLSAGMIAVAKRNHPDIAFFHQDLRTFTPEKPVDAVWAGYCLFHLEREDFVKVLGKIRSYVKPGGVFGFVMQEGEGELDTNEPLLPGEKIYVHLYTEQELTELLLQNGFEVIEKKVKKPMYEMEFPYNKLLLIAK